MINENELTSSSLSEQPSDEPNKKLDSTRTVSTLLNNFISERNSWQFRKRLDFKKSACSNISIDIYAKSNLNQETEQTKPHYIREYQLKKGKKRRLMMI